MSQVLLSSPSCSAISGSLPSKDDISEDYAYFSYTFFFTVPSDPGTTREEDEKVVVDTVDILFVL